jgi:ADP-dependent NAD(P)H-hydrate dehydratase / NAD(P)H-hydrate epimerase
MLLLTAAEMRALDRATIDSGLVTGAELMERAGRGVAVAAVKHLGSPLALRVLVLCGPGNNGGDGFVAARHLRAMGASVRVGLVAPRAQVHDDALAHLERMEAAGVPAEPADTDATLAALVGTTERWDWALDALLGTGASGELRGMMPAATEALRRLHAHGTRIVAVDLPTGVSSDDGSVTEHAVAAHLTVTFGYPKRGNFLHPGREHCGLLERVDIGLLPPERAGLSPARLAVGSELGALLPSRDPRAHKGTAGRVLVVGGAMGMAGAVMLAARAASRAGAGYVRVAVPASLADVIAAQLVEQMPLACGEGSQRSLTTSAAPQILEEASRADAVAIGPGLSRDPDAVRLARDLLAHMDMPVVLDADGLSAFAPPDGNLEAALRGAPAPRVVTPHLGEMARLTGEMPSALEARRVDAAREWAKRWGCVLVLKGAPTVVAAPDGRVSVNPTGNAGMATAGMGDVLTGVVAALLAQRLAPFDAACLAVFVHGLAGDFAADDIGPVGLVASDVVERLPRALHALHGSFATC